MKEYYRDKSAVVLLDAERDILLLQYLGRVNGDEQFIEINSAVIEAFRLLETNKFVADIRHMGVISLNSQRWVVDKLLPTLMEHLKGRKLYHAQLMDSSEIFAKVSGSNIRNKAHILQEGFEIKQFTQEEALYHYLATV